MSWRTAAPYSRTDSSHFSFRVRSIAGRRVVRPSGTRRTFDIADQGPLLPCNRLAGVSVRWATNYSFNIIQAQPSKTTPEAAPTRTREGFRAERSSSRLASLQHYNAVFGQKDANLACARTMFRLRSSEYSRPRRPADCSGCFWTPNSTCSGAVVEARSIS